MTNISQMSTKYVSMQIKTAPNPANICMLHTKCVHFIKLAIASDQTPNRLLIIKAQNIIAELERALTVDDDLSQSLFYIYDYCYTLLDTTDYGKINNALTLLTLLRDTFTELSKPS